MAATTIPASIQPLFGQVSEPVSVLDEQGNVLGYYTPMREATKEDYEWTRRQFSPDEIEAARRSGPARPLADILADLKRRYGS